MEPDKDRRFNEYDMLRQALANLQAITDSASPSELLVGENDRLIMPSQEEMAMGLHGGDATKKVEVMKNTFRYILEYIRRIYQKDKEAVTSNKALLQGIQTIMVLVGEAANKLDRYTSLFKRAHGFSFLELKEYRDLQDFYINTIVKPSQERLALKKPPSEILASSHERQFLAEDEEEIVAESLADIETVIADTDYELFYLFREDGSRFFTPELVRQMHVACEKNITSDTMYVGDDPFLQIKNWEDRQLQMLSSQCLTSLRQQMDTFYRAALKQQDIELIAYLHRALMALMLGSSQRNMLRRFAVKSCYQYFQDFQSFLKQAMRCAEYAKLIDRPARSSQGILKSAIEIIHQLCFIIYTHVPPRGEVVAGLNEMEKKGLQLLQQQPLSDEQKDVCDHLQQAYRAIEAVVRHFPSGPLFKALDLAIDEEQKIFDPIGMGNYPYTLYDLYFDNRLLEVLHLPCPIYQKHIHKAFINEEFRGFLRALADKSKHIVMINLQDRTSWKEHSRCIAIEEIQLQAEFSDQITVATLAKHTDFYYQLPPYRHLDDAKEFLTQFQEHIVSEQSGFYFSPKLRESFLAHHLQSLIQAVHELFFGGKQQLTRNERLNFIELSYMLMSCKIADLCKADYLSLFSKDGIDAGCVDSVQLYIFIKLLSGKPIEEIDLLKEMLFAPALMLRERLVHSERFLRLYHCLKHVAGILSPLSEQGRKKKFSKILGALFSFSFLSSEQTIPQKE